MVHADVNEDLQDAHPGWKLWRSRGGSWMATRRRVLGFDELFPGIRANTLMEKTPEDLATKLEQQRLAGGAA